MQKEREEREGEREERKEENKSTEKQKKEMKTPTCVEGSGGFVEIMKKIS